MATIIKNSWSQGRPSSSPVQSIVSLELDNKVICLYLCIFQRSPIKSNKTIHYIYRHLSRYGHKTKPYSVIIVQRSFVHRFAIFPIKWSKSAEKPIVQKWKKIFPLKISPRVTFRNTGHLNGCTDWYRNNPSKTSKKWRNWSWIGITHVNIFTVHLIWLLSWFVYCKIQWGQDLLLRAPDVTPDSMGFMLLISLLAKVKFFSVKFYFQPIYTDEGHYKVLFYDHIY
jgi:hypothetical protein